MAMDNFLEEVATKRNRGAETVMYVLANIMMVVFGLWAFLMLQGIMMLINAGEGAGPIIYYVVMPNFFLMPNIASCILRSRSNLISSSLCCCSCAATASALSMNIPSPTARWTLHRCLTTKSARTWAP